MIPLYCYLISDWTFLLPQTTQDIHLSTTDKYTQRENIKKIYLPERGQISNLLGNTCLLFVSLRNIYAIFLLSFLRVCFLTSENRFTVVFLQRQCQNISFFLTLLRSLMLHKAIFQFLFLIILMFIIVLSLVDVAFLGCFYPRTKHKRMCFTFCFLLSIICSPFLCLCNRDPKYFVCYFLRDLK